MEFREQDVPNSIVYADLEAFQTIHIKYNENYIREFIEWANKHASVHELALQILNFYEYWHMFEYEGLYKPILLWKYWVVREAFVRKFKKYFNLGEDPKRQTENFIRIYLENPDETFEDIWYNTLGYKFSEGCYIYSFRLVLDIFTKLETVV